MKLERPAKKVSLHEKLLQEIEDLGQKQDLLLVKLLITNIRKLATITE